MLRVEGGNSKQVEKAERQKRACSRTVEAESA